LSSLKQVEIFTDGACLGNPGPGGYGVILKYDHHKKELSGGYRLTTNSRMELMAAIVGLSALKQPCRVTLFSDSQYLVKSIMDGHVNRWEANGWKRNKKEPALNADLWRQLVELCRQHQVTFEWVRGHTGLPENERCDQLSVRAAGKPNLPPDEGYEGKDQEHLPLIEP